MPDSSKGKTHRGAPAIETWLTRPAGEYTYTIELTGVQKVDVDHYIATHHFEGSFPGGVVDLHYRFTLSGGLIENLVIEFWPAPTHAPASSTELATQFRRNGWSLRAMTSTLTHSDIGI